MLSQKRSGTGELQSWFQAARVIARQALRIARKNFAFVHNDGSLPAQVHVDAGFCFHFGDKFGINPRARLRQLMQCGFRVTAGGRQHSRRGVRGFAPRLASFDHHHAQAAAP